jgi:hypothetical protein
MLSVTVFYAPHNQRSKMIADVALNGFRVLGIHAKLRNSLSYVEPDSDVAVFYGLAEGLDKVFADYKKEGKAIYIDLGYWGRRLSGRFDGYHKISINNRHATDYFQQRDYSSNRFDEFNIPIKPWRRYGNSIVIAGMSAKACWAEGLAPEQWERATVAELIKTTRRKIVYRPKPSWPGAKPIPGTIMQKSIDIAPCLQRCHAVVTHHSNLAIDAILAGVPAFCVEGLASAMSLSDLSQIENPIMPDNRHQWASNIAWTQFTPTEIHAGLPWQHMLNEGLI